MILTPQGIWPDSSAEARYGLAAEGKTRRARRSPCTAMLFVTAGGQGSADDDGALYDAVERALGEAR